MAGKPSEKMHAGKLKQEPATKTKLQVGEIAAERGASEKAALKKESKKSKAFVEKGAEIYAKA